jgi:hypothetical protein
MEEDDLNPENFCLAEQLLQPAVELDPTDGEVLAVTPTCPAPRSRVAVAAVMVGLINP